MRNVANVVKPSNWVSFGLFILCTFLTGTVFSAEPNVNNSVQNQERWLKEQQDRLKEQQQPYRVSPDVFLQQKLESDSKDSEQQDTDTRCFDIQHLIFQGVTALSQDDLEQVRWSYEHTCLGMNKIRAIIKDITNLYIEKGFITSRAFVQPQNLSLGTLTITVVEGKVENITSVDTTLTPLQLEMAFPVSSENVLNLRDLEQGLEQLNRLQMNNAKTELVPGVDDGTSTVAIKNTRGNWWRGGVGITNKEANDFNIGQLDGNLAADNLFGINDNILFSVSTEFGNEELHSSSNSYAFMGSVPLGYWLFEVSSNYFEYEQTVRGQIVNFLSHGSASVNSLSVSNMVYRGQNDKLKISGSMTRKQTKNYIEDVFLNTSSRVLYIAGVDVDYSKYFNDGSMLTLDFKWDRSLSWWGATTKVVAAEDDYQFDKYTLNFLYQRAIKTESIGDLDYRINGMYLYSPDVIVASEGVSIGGRYDVRGFGDNSLFGYQGGYFRNEIGKLLPFQNELVRQIRNYAAIDFGSVKTDTGFSEKYKELVSASIGMQIYGSNFSIDLIYSQALYKPDFFIAEEHTFYASARLNF